MRRVSLAMVGLLVLVAGACGAEGGGGSGDRPALPWAAGGSGAAGASTQSLAAEAAGGVARDMAMPYRSVTYELADGVSAKESGAAYRVDGGAVTSEDVSSLAKALGMSADVGEENDSWKVTSGDRTLWVSTFDGSWNVGPADGVTVSATSSASATAVCDSSGECTQEEGVRPPPAPEPLADLPSKEEAADIGRDLADAIGLDDVEVGEVSGDPSYGWSVMLTPAFDGVPAYGLQSFLTIGSGGEIISGGGSLATPAKVGDYPLVSARAAFDRYNDGTFGGGGGVGMGRPAIGGAEPAPAPLVDQGAVEEGVVDPDSTEPASPTDPAPPTEEIAPEPQPMPDRVPEDTLPPEVVKLDEVRLVLTPAYGMCPGDSYYLVPAFEFSKGTEHVVGPVIAVEDGDIASADGDAVVASDDAGCTTPDGRKPDVPTSDGGGSSSGGGGSPGSSGSGGASSPGYEGTGVAEPNSP